MKLKFAINCPRNNYLREPRISFFAADGVPEQKMILVEFISHKQRLLDNETQPSLFRISFGTVFPFAADKVEKSKPSHRFRVIAETNASPFWRSRLRDFIKSLARHLPVADMNRDIA